MSRCWPSELNLRIVESHGDAYVASFNLLGQKWLVRFKIRETGDLSQFHETTDFPFGKLVHEIQITPVEGGAQVYEKMVLETRVPFAGWFLRRILEYREAMVRKSFGVESEIFYRDPLKISIGVGTGVSVVAVAIAASLLLIPASPNLLLDLVQRLIPWLLLWFFTHDLAHLVIGSLVGVRFSHYYIGLSNIVRLGIIPPALRLLPLALGIKIDRARSKATPSGYAAMYTAGPLASMLTPLAASLTLIQLHGLTPTPIILLAVSTANIAFTTYFSPKAGCLAKAKKALKRDKTLIKLKNNQHISSNGRPG